MNRLRLKRDAGQQMDRLRQKYDAGRQTSRLCLRNDAGQMYMHRMFAQVTSDFLTVNRLNFDEKVDRLLRTIGEYHQVDLVSLVIADKKSHQVKYTRTWEASHTAREIKSMLAVPLTCDGETKTYLKLDSYQASRMWTKDHISSLKIFANVLYDAFNKLEAEEKEHFLAYHDPLTGLPNRAQFNEKLGQALSRARQTGDRFGLLYLDVDSFKMANGVLGHDGGDQLLKQISQKLSRSIRESDVLSRFGGDEFLVLVNGVKDAQAVTEVAERLVAVASRPFQMYGHEFHVSFSMGVASYPQDGEDAAALIKNAYAAMHMAKESGKNRYVVSNERMKDSLDRAARLINGLASAVKRKELFLNYQPQLDIETGKIVGVEALLRWRHPEWGLIAPDEFIPLAEKSGLIHHIGEWVIRTASAQGKAWQDMGLPPMRVAVNLSPVQFNDLKFVERVQHILHETGLAPEYLELEITERIAYNTMPAIREGLERLKAMGIFISIDDFGMEYSTLSRLTTIPIDSIKMDKHFVQGIDIDEKEQIIARTIIFLAKNIGFTLVAEGVETATQLEFLKNNKCDIVQGYYYFKPLPSAAIEALLKNPPKVNPDAAPDAGEGCRGKEGNE